MSQRRPTFLWTRNHGSGRKSAVLWMPFFGALGLTSFKGPFKRIGCEGAEAAAGNRTFRRLDGSPRVRDLFEPPPARCQGSAYVNTIMASCNFDKVVPTVLSNKVFQNMPPTSTSVKPPTSRSRAASARLSRGRLLPTWCSIASQSCPL